MSHFIVAFLILSALMFFVGDGWAVRLDGVTSTIAGAPSPAAAAGLLPGDTILRIGDLQSPTRDQLGAYMNDHPGQRIPLTVERDGKTFEVTVTPVYDRSLDPAIWRLGVTLGPVRRPLPAALAGGAVQLGQFAKDAVVGIGKVFGPQGIHRLFSLVFTNAPRDQGDAQSLVGVSKQVGVIGQSGQWAYFFLVFAYVTLFIGLVNLIPLPPFDGGHLAILLLEKVRGRKVDMRRVVPVSAAVLIFLGFFVFSTVVLDLLKPVPNAP